MTALWITLSLITWLGGTWGWSLLALHADEEGHPRRCALYVLLAAFTFIYPIVQFVVWVTS